jgi:hypothetical protein
MTTERLTHGSTRQVLEINGYMACSTSGAVGYRAADEDAAILLMNKGECRLEDWKSRRVVALTICARNPKVRAELGEILKKYKLASNVVRTASDGSQTHLLRCDNSYGGVFSRESPAADGETDPAVAVDGEGRCQADGSYPPPRILRLDGDWGPKNASPLIVPRPELPEYRESEAFLNDMAEVLRANAKKVESASGFPKRAPEPEEGMPVQAPPTYYRPQPFAPFEDYRRHGYTGNGLEKLGRPDR